MMCVSIVTMWRTHSILHFGFGHWFLNRMGANFGHHFDVPFHVFDWLSFCCGRGTFMELWPVVSQYAPFQHPRDECIGIVRTIHLGGRLRHRAVPYRRQYARMKGADSLFRNPRLK